MEGRLVWSKLTRQDYAEARASDADTEGVIDLLRTARGCQIAALFRVTERGRAKASLRSEPPFDVASVAARFGGGGHAYAAGFSSSRSLDEIVSETMQELQRLLEGAGTA
jgi:phosphoesterase RecJ-like protein